MRTRFWNYLIKKRNASKSIFIKYHKKKSNWLRQIFRMYRSGDKSVIYDLKMFFFLAKTNLELLLEFQQWIYKGLKFDICWVRSFLHIAPCSTKPYFSTIFHHHRNFVVTKIDWRAVHLITQTINWISFICVRIFFSHWFHTIFVALTEQSYWTGCTLRFHFFFQSKVTSN